MAAKSRRCEGLIRMIEVSGRIFVKCRRITVCLSALLISQDTHPQRHNLPCPVGKVLLTLRESPGMSVPDDNLTSGTWSRGI